MKREPQVRALERRVLAAFDRVLEWESRQMHETGAPVLLAMIRAEIAEPYSKLARELDP